MGNNLKNGARNEKEKMEQSLAVLLMMAMSISLLSACGGKSAEKEDAETIQPIMKKCGKDIFEL